MIEGVKEITLENWDKPDDIVYIYDREGRNIYLNEILSITLGESVPVNVSNMFEIARNMMVYGYYYCPLYTLAIEQMHRVGEAAAKEKAKQLKQYVPDKMSYHKCIKLLQDHGFLDEISFYRWNIIRGLRNNSSHADRYQLLPPKMVIEHVKVFANEINKLFKTKP